jgi:hypothetical protein
VSYHCVNKGDNFAPGHPATSTNVVGPSQDISPHNGQITFNVSLRAPVPSAAYVNVVLHIQQNGQDVPDRWATHLHGPVGSYTTGAIGRAGRRPALLAGLGPGRPSTW